jgi:hypothetical protein
VFPNHYKTSFIGSEAVGSEFSSRCKILEKLVTI